MILFQDQWVLPFLFWLILLLLREVYLLFVLVARFTFWGQECLGSLSTVMQGGPTTCIWRRGKYNHIHHETFSSQHRKPSCSPFALQEARKSVYSLLVIQILYAFSGWWNENNVNVDLQTASPFTHNLYIQGITSRWLKVSSSRGSPVSKLDETSKPTGSYTQ